MTHKDSGYTIIEALCALAILSVALTTLYRASATSLRASAHIASVDRAILLAQSKLDEIAATPTSIPDKSSGIFAGESVRWTVTADAIDGGVAVRGSPILQAVHLVLSWRDGIHDQSLVIETRHLGRVPS